jgi:hypothetical protein
MAEDLADTIEQAAGTPESASADGTSAKARSIPDLIEADRYLASKRAAHADPRKALTRVKIVPPGAV